MEPNTLAQLKKVAGRQTTWLTHYGRKTRKPYQVTIWFVLDDSKLFIGTANVNRQWVRNVQTTPQIKLSIGAEKFEGRARFLAGRLRLLPRVPYLVPGEPEPVLRPGMAAERLGHAS